MPSDLIRETSNGRFYDIGGVLYPSVTNVLDPLSQANLVEWSAWEAVKATIAALPQLVASLLKPKCGRTWFDHAHEWTVPCLPTCPCGTCTPCMHLKLARTHKAISSRRSDEGKKVHSYIEDWVLSDGKIKRSVPPEVQPYIDSFHAMCAAYGLTPESWLFCEAVVYHPVERYAGTTDGALRIHAGASRKAAELVAAILQIPVAEAVANDRHVDVLDDVKTKEKAPDEGRSTELYPTHALQAAPYRLAPKVMIKNTAVFAEMPHTDGAVIIQLRPDGFDVRPVKADEETLEAFLHQLKVRNWVRDKGTASVSPKLLKSPAPAKATRKRAAKKATAKATPAATNAADLPAPRGRARKQTAGALGMSLRPAAPLFPKGPTPHPDSPVGDEIPF